MLGVVIGVLVTLGCMHLSQVFDLGLWGFVGSIAAGLLVVGKSK